VAQATVAVELASVGEIAGYDDVRLGAVLFDVVERQAQIGHGVNTVQAVVVARQDVGIGQMHDRAGWGRCWHVESPSGN
jgi:hypothetical protein